MKRFWLGTWSVDGPLPEMPGPAEPIAVSGAALLALEVLQDDEQYVVLISAADHAEEPQSLQCLIGFANGASACSLLRSRGFPLVEACISYRDGLLKVYSPHFSDPKVMQYFELLFEVEGVQFADATVPYRPFELSFAVRRFLRQPRARVCQVRCAGPRAESGAGVRGRLLPPVS